MNILEKLSHARENGEVGEKVAEIFTTLYTSYAHSLVMSGFKMELFDHLFDELLFLVKEEEKHPHTFESYHERLLKPYNYYRFGNEFIRPLIDEQKSRVHFPENIEKIDRQIAAKENVILFANHQTEVDPQILSLTFEKSYPRLAEETIFVAGDRVLTDLMAVPFSLGRNLLCIYSKRHIDNPPEKKASKLQHNQRTMKVMKDLLASGGRCIYVAPSGGRDRPNEQGEVIVAPFDPQSIEMFRLMALQAKTPTHYYPLSLATFDILPPPQSIQKEIGENRKAKRSGVMCAFGDEVDLDHFPGAELVDRHEKRSARAAYLWNLVNHHYTQLKKEMS